MINTEGLLLNRILEDADLESFSKLKISYFSSSYKSIFKTIQFYYKKHNKVPTFDELEVSCRNSATLTELSMIKSIAEYEDVDTEFILEAVIDKYAQRLALTGISGIVSKITDLGADSIQEEIGSLLVDLDKNLSNNESLVVSTPDYRIFQPEETTEGKVLETGINFIDNTLGGFRREELVLLGGFRGSGKSICCANVAIQQFIKGNVGVYFTIEMTAEETYQRMYAMLAEVNFQNIRNNNLSREDKDSLGKVRASMFEGGEELFESREFKDHFDLEQKLLELPPKEHNQLVVVDSSSLTITQIDLELRKLKAIHGDKLGVVAVDYLNQISLGGSDSNQQYDWKYQILISKHLKNLARKHDVCIFCPYQIDEDGKIKFSKAILDPPDLALHLKKQEKDDVYNFECKKARSTAANFSFDLRINPQTLRLDGREYVASEEVKEKAKKEDLTDSWT